MSPDRVVYSFILGWVALIVLLIALDWLGNPNRGAFRPKGDRPQRNHKTRKMERARRRLENDASVRASLRDAYGASSLRVTWTSEQEVSARRLDDALVIDPAAGTVDVESREVTTIDRTIIMGDPLPNIDEEVVDPNEPDEQPTRGWNIGGDPLSLTLRGSEPTPGTIRARVWKNHGVSGAWSEENRALLSAGKAPRRTNPFTGRHERAIVDVDTGRATWGSEPVDPFGDEAGP